MKPRILLVGYNGANNTGAEAKLLVIINEIRSIVGPDACITVPSLNEANLRRYLQEGPNLKIEAVRPSLFFLDIRKFVKENDLIVLVEGSCYMDTWGFALLWFYLLATRYAHSMKKPCVAYSVDAGEASRFNSWLIRREASKTNLILSRTQKAADRLKKWKVTAPIEVTADNAFAFHPDPKDAGLLKRSGPKPPMWWVWLQRTSTCGPFRSVFGHRKGTATDGPTTTRTHGKVVPKANFSLTCWPIKQMR